MENHNWNQIYNKVSAEAEAAKEKSRQGLLLSQREAAVVREKELYDRIEREKTTTPEPKIADDSQTDRPVSAKIGQPAPEITVATDTQNDTPTERVQDDTPENDIMDKYKTDYAHTRAAAWHTIHKLENSPHQTYADLYAETEDAGDKKFLELTRNLWTEFAVHGMSGDGGKTWAKESDLDGESCLMLMDLAGIKIDRDKVTFLPKGDTLESGIIMDTSGRDGVLSENGGKVLIFDHHDKDKSTRGTSATKFVYETLVDMGLLTREPYLDQYVDFVTRMDNFDIPQDQWNAICANYPKNLYGLANALEVHDVIALFKNNTDPAQPLEPEYLAQHEYTMRDGQKKTLETLSKEIENHMENAKRDIAELEREGLVFDSGANHFGKILIDPKKVLTNGRAYNRVSGSGASAQLSVFNEKDPDGKPKYGAYMIWSPEQNSFVIYTKNAMTFGPALDEKRDGLMVREHMWMYPNNDKPLQIGLKDLLSRLSGDDRDIPPSLQKALRTNDLAKEIMTDIAENKDFTTASLRERFAKKNIPTENVFSILKNQSVTLRRIYKEKIDEKTKGFDATRKKEFLTALRKNKGNAYTPQQKADREIWENVYLESLCTLNAKNGNGKSAA
ncbi:MAG: hypothetical protein WC819_04335 [Parcubacteria group bacterium]|jgi:hypothetical protein